MAERRHGSGRTHGGAGCLLWLAVLVVVLFLFVLNWGKIKTTLESTNFTDIVRTQRGSEPPSSPAPPPVTPAPKVEEEPRKQAQPESKGAEDSTKPPIAAPESGGSAKNPAQTGQPASPKTQPGQAQAKTRSALLFFVRIDETDGSIIFNEVKRQIAASDSPLSDALDALLKGPTADEIGRKLMTLVPQGTRLLGVTVRGATAIINFSEAFMYNRYGIEGCAGQLKQIVYTATSFPSIQEAQILIEGERHEYLGGEGVYIGKPLSRNSF